MPERLVKVADDLEALSLCVCDAFCRQVHQAIKERNVCRIALSGGSTPVGLYRLLAQSDLPWSRVQIYWGDERNVPHDHPDSNFRMVNETLLQPANIPQESIFAPTILPDTPSGTARQYEQTLRSQFNEQAFPRWDIALQGMGDDAHTASLFPETVGLKEQQRWFIENWVPKLDAYRLTLTLPAIVSSRNVWFMIAGANKREALERVWNGPENPDLYPSQSIHPIDGELRWFITADANPAS